MKVHGEREFAAQRQTVWGVLQDPAQMAALMPHVESFDVEDDRRWKANVKIPLGLGSLKMSIKFEKLEEVEHPASHRPAAAMIRGRAIPVSMSKPCGNARNTGLRQAMGGWLRILHFLAPRRIPPRTNARSRSSLSRAGARSQGAE